MSRHERELQKAFPYARIERTNGNHLKLVLPNGRFVIVAGTTTCQRLIRNTRKFVKREMQR